MKDQKAILFFLLKFIGLYIVLNTVYGSWVAYYAPMPDPVTTMVTHHTAALLSLTQENVSVGEAINSPNVPLRQDNETVVSVFEGCNSLNVMFVFISFIVAFTGTWKKTIVFSLIGIALIYTFNLFRVGLLFYIAKYWPNNLYFFHKYLFTGLLYAMVFFLWYFWVKRVWPAKGS
jgi:exosortase family protein XrtF